MSDISYNPQLSFFVHIYSGIEFESIIFWKLKEMLYPRNHTWKELGPRQTDGLLG